MSQRRTGRIGRFALFLLRLWQKRHSAFAIAVVLELSRSYSARVANRAAAGGFFMRVLVLTAGLVFAMPALAGPADNPSKAFDTLTSCRKIGDDTERLACFDRSIAAFADARSKGDVVVIDRTRVVERKRARFGLPLNSGEVFGGGAEDRATEVRELDTTVRNAAVSRGDIWTMELANGSVWRTTESLPFAVRSGQAVKLKVAPLGGYRASVAGRSSVLVKRVR